MGRPSLFRGFRNFNSIKVRLERRKAHRSKIVNINFNSIKVRLEPEFDAIGFEATPRFQFHKGTIRTVRLVSADAI